MTTKTCINWRTKVHKNHVNYPSGIFVLSSLEPSINTVNQLISQFTGNIQLNGD